MRFVNSVSSQLAMVFYSVIYITLLIRIPAYHSTRCLYLICSILVVTQEKDVCSVDRSQIVQILLYLECLILALIVTFNLNISINIFLLRFAQN